MNQDLTTMSEDELCDRLMFPPEPTCAVRAEIKRRCRQVPPADDGEPLTEAWLESVGFVRYDCSWHGPGAQPDGFILDDRLGVRDDEATRGWAGYLVDHDGFDGSQDYLSEATTRGHVRRLAAALGIALTEAARP